MRQRDRRRADKLGIEAELRARGVAQAAVDAAGELVILGHLRRGLHVRAVFRFAIVADDVRLDRLRAFDEVGHVDHQIALDREVAQRFDLHAADVIAQEGFARQLRHAVDHHAAGAADRHAAGPAVGEIRRRCP